MRPPNRRINFRCDNCGIMAYDRLSHYKRKIRHFCSKRCYALFRTNHLPKEEQHAYANGGMPLNEKAKRTRARSHLNHAVRDGLLVRLPCQSCGNPKSEGHHHNYDSPLEVKWLCKMCHVEEHKLIYQNPELLKENS